MLRVVTHVLTALVFLAIGLWYGYGKALMNQLYYDAPAKISVYNAVLEETSSEEFLKGGIVKELRNIEFGRAETSPILLYHPVHTEVRKGFEKYETKISNLERVNEARVLMKTYNKNSNKSDGYAAD